MLLLKKLVAAHPAAVPTGRRRALPCPPCCVLLLNMKQRLEGASDGPRNVRIPGEAAQDSGMMSPSHSEMMPPTVPR